MKFNKYNLMDRIWVVVNNPYPDPKNPLSRSVAVSRTVIGIMVGNMNIETKPLVPTTIRYSLLDESNFKYQIFPEDQIYDSYEDAKEVADKINNTIISN